MPRTRAALALTLARFAFQDKSLVLLTQGLGPQPFHGKVVILVSEWTNSAVVPSNERVPSLGSSSASPLDRCVSVLASPSPSRSVLAGFLSLRHRGCVARPLPSLLYSSKYFPTPGAAYAPQDLRPKQPLQFPIGCVPFPGCPRSQCEYTQKRPARSRVPAPLSAQYGKPSPPKTNTTRQNWLPCSEIDPSS